MSEESDRYQKMQKAKSLFDYGNDAAMKSNYDYAIAMYRDALRLEPGNLKYRQALRGIQRKVFNNDPTSVGRLAGARVQPIKLGVKTSKAKKKWLDVIEGCEDVFKHNPWDVGAAEDASEAAEHLGLNDLAEWLLSVMWANAGKNEAYYIHLGRISELNQKWEQAIACWEKAYSINPANEESKRKVRALAASSAISRAGLEGQLSRHAEAVPSPQEKALAEAEELKKNALTPEQRLEKEIEEDPSRIGLYLQLADIHKAHNRLDDAEKVLNQGRKAAPTDTMLRTAHGDIQLLRLRRAIDVFTKKVKDNPEDAEAKEKLSQLKDKLSSYELAEFRRRCEAHPEDANLHFRFGVLLAATGKHDEAIGEFQKSRSDPELKAKALYQAALSFEAKGLAKLAEKNLIDSLALSDPNDTDFRNSLRYRLGRVSEMQGKKKEAEEYYNEVAAEDYTYLDVAERLQALNDGEHS